MARTLTTRLERLEARTPDEAGPVVTIWEQAGADAYTCTDRPGEVLTYAEVHALPTGGPGFSVIVVRMPPDEEGATPPARPDRGEPAAPPWYPDGLMPSWTDAELWAVLEHYDPTLRERVHNMTDAELIAELQRIAHG